VPDAGVVCEAASLVIDPHPHGLGLGIGEAVLVVEGKEAEPGVEVGREVAASIQLRFVVQDLAGRLCRPMALFVRTRSSTTAWWRCRASIHWAWWEPTTPHSLVMLVAMMEYFQPVFFSRSVRFSACRPDGLTRRTISRMPFSQPLRRLRPVTSATAL
jgi:hypothetical protein